MKNIYIETYGCSANQSHSETMEGMLVDNGFRITKEIEQADAIVINTCIVKSPTENKIRERIKFLFRKYPKKRLVIAGCAADVGLFKDIIPKALFLSSHKSKDIAKLFLKQAKETDRRIRRNPLINITEIASGCMGRCAYCIVKLARGDLRSRTAEDITKEIERSIDEGCKEIWITSQDCGCYGLDIKTNLAELLRKIIGVNGDFRIRIGMMNPTYIKGITKELIEVYKNPKIYKFIHIPVQSGSDRVLEFMKRDYSVKDFEKIIEDFRREFSDITLSTDIIVGFPGETEKDFEKTTRLVEKIRPDIVNVSKFAPRPGTEAFRMRQLDNKMIKERSKKFAVLVRKISLEKNEKWTGRECKILITERGKRKNQFMGRNECYKPVIIEGKENVMGKFFKVRIVTSGQSYLGAEIIRNSV